LSIGTGHGAARQDLPGKMSRAKIETPLPGRSV